jgi:putative hemolysin
VDPSLNLFLVWCALLGASAFFSGSETALFSLDRVQLERLQQKSGIVFRFLHYLLLRPYRLLTTTVAGNELVNIAIAATSTAAFHHYLEPRGLGQWTPLVDALVVTPAVVLFGEISPKVLALRSNVLFARLFALPLYFFYQLMTPVRVVLMVIVQRILRVVGVPPQKDNPLTENEFLVMIDESLDAGHLNPRDQRYIENVFEFTEHKGVEIMRPLEKVFALPAEISVADALGRFRDAGYSRAPIFKGEPHHIIGVVHARDLLRVQAETMLQPILYPVRDIMRPAFYAGASWPINKILKEMKKNRRQMAIVRTDTAEQDRKREAIGIIAMEDIIEELFGRIEDERDLEARDES